MVPNVESFLQLGNEPSSIRNLVPNWFQLVPHIF